MDEESADLLNSHLDERSRARAQSFAPAAPIAALALAVVSLIGVGPAQLLSQVVLYHGHDFRSLAVSPGIAAVVAAIGVWLARLALRTPAMSWQRSLGSAAMVVGVVAVVLNVAAFIGALTISEPSGLVSG